MTTAQAFIASLEPGDLVAATVQSSSKLHLIHVVRRVTMDMVRGTPSADRLAQMIDGRPVCEVRPRFWWTPVERLEDWKDQDKCRWCFSRWRAQGRPLVKGWKHPEAPVIDDYRLPWGWHEVSPTGHPLDLPLDAPDPDEDEEEKKVGSKRKEVKRWLRGNRYVRITQDVVDSRFCVRYGALDDDEDDENWWLKGGWDEVLLRAVTLMALGGKPVGNTSHSKLTMQSIVKGRE